MLAIPDIVVSISLAKPALSPTYTPEIVALSVCDIIILSIQGMAGVICYVSPVLTTLKTLRYTKHICTISILQILSE
jgi:hypothetical protein